MRALVSSIGFLAIAAPAYAAGAYATLSGRDAAACARLCAEDGLCLAWSMSANGACELRATAPATPFTGEHGFSSRAPTQLRQSLLNEARPAAAPSQAPASAPIAAVEEPAVIAEPPPFSAMITEDDMTLLGGPETEASSDLRPRLGLRR